MNFRRKKVHKRGLFFQRKRKGKEFSFENTMFTVKLYFIGYRFYLLTGDNFG